MQLDDDKVTKTNSNQADTSTESDTTAANANAIATMVRMCVYMYQVHYNIILSYGVIRNTFI